MHRVMGIETEYGISVPGHPHVNSMLTSSQVVNAYAGAASASRLKARWDYDEETPLRDARGFDLTRAEADPSQITDDDPGLANLILTNGARLYVDHAHPEYSSPEVTNPFDAVVWDKAGERIMARAAELVRRIPGAQPVNLYKNNTDNKGASYGTHENYLMRRTTPFADIVRHLTPFFVSRQVVTGSGRVGIGQDGRKHGYQLTQRADFFEVEVGLETTLKRPIINTRDEPHSDPEKYRRLHVIVGDANLAEVSTYLKLGTTSLVLAMLEDGFLDVDLVMDAPVREMHQVSHDPSLRHLVTMSSGRRLTAVQMQLEFLEQARKYVEDRVGSDVDVQTADVLDRWESVLDAARDRPDEPVPRARLGRQAGGAPGLPGPRRPRLGPRPAAPRRPAVQRRARGQGPGPAAAGPRHARADHHRRAGRLRRHARRPTDTRAWFRGECMRRYPEHVAAASWDSVIFDVPGRDALQRVPTLEPLRGTRAHVGELLDRCATAQDLLAALDHRD